MPLRILKGNLLFIFAFISSGILAQGFERTLNLDTLDGRVTSLRVVNNNILELDVTVCRSGPGLDGCRYLKTWYYIKEDSLGAQRSYSSSFFGGRSDQLLVKDELWLNFYHDNTSCGGRSFLNMSVLKLGNQSVKLPDYYDWTFISGAYNALYLNDTIYAYHGQSGCMEDSPGINGNDTLYYYWVDIEKGEINYLDTIALGFPMYLPGSLIHDSTTGQNVLFYDSLRIYLKPARSSPDSTVVDSSLWEMPFGDHWSGNMERHYWAFTYNQGAYRNQRVVWDTLGAYRVDVFTDWFGKSGQVVYPLVPDYPDYEDIGVLKINRESDSVLTYGIIGAQRSSQSIDLYRLVNEKVVKHSRYAAPPGVTYFLNSVTSDAEGNFYIAGNLSLRGNRSYWFYDPDEYGLYNILLIKVDANGMSRDYTKGDPFSLQQDLITRDGTAISFKTQDPNELVSYRLLDVSGRSYAAGRTYSGALINTSTLKKGLYYLSLWGEEGNYIGQQAFIKN